MKLTREIAQAEAARLQSSVMLCPQSKEGRAEIVDCLLRNCQDAEHARRTMTQLLDNALEVKGALTAWIANFARAGLSPEQPPPGCSRCDAGPQWPDGAQGWSAFVSARGRNGVERCDCERGQWMAAKDADRNAGAEKAEKRPAPKRLERVRS